LQGFRDFAKRAQALQQAALQTFCKRTERQQAALDGARWHEVALELGAGRRREAASTVSGWKEVEVTEPLNPDQVARLIAHAVVTFLDTGETGELTTKPRSSCLFFDRFIAGSYEVQLRLHWADLDKNGHPKLDADFYALGAGRIDHSMRGNPAHHTSSTGSGERSYEWKFANATRRFTVAITWSPTAFACASSAAFAEARVVRAQPAEGGD
jgi:hypothetical protein